MITNLGKRFNSIANIIITLKIWGILFRYWKRENYISDSKLKHNAIKTRYFEYV
uniref:Transposase n=1 Tax=Heterorhabditis bacteriophora TaxID=37862 RepID=A0A1I7WKL2_HETBA